MSFFFNEKKNKKKDFELITTLDLSNLEQVHGPKIRDNLKKENIAFSTMLFLHEVNGTR